LTRMTTQAERQVILDGLTSSDGEVRRLSVEQLPELGIEEAVPHLAERLGDEVWRVRKSAVERLVHCIDHPPVQEILVASLADGEDPGRRNSAFVALVACGSRVTSRLIAEMSSSDVDVRKLVVDALAAIADPECREPMVLALQDPDTNVRAAAAEALGMVGDADEIEPLLAAVQAEDEDILVRLSALGALTRLEADVQVDVVGTACDQAPLRAASLSLLGWSTDPAALEVLVKSLASASRSSREASMGALLRRLGRLDGADEVALRARLREAASASDELVPGACERLEGGDLSKRLILIQFLGLLEDDRVVVPILKAGRDEAISELADSTLESLGDIVPSALDAAWEDLDFESKRRACVVLGRIGGEIAERRLVDALAAHDVELRCAAVTAMGRGDFLEVLPELARRLEVVARDDHGDGEEEVAALMDAIVEMAGRPEAVEAGLDIQLIASLSSRLGGAPEAVRLAIAQVLAKLGREEDEDVISYLLKDESAAVRRAAVQSLGRFDFSHSRDALRLALNDESEWVRTVATNVLGEMDDIAAIEDIERMTRDEDPRVVAAAMRALGRLCGSVEPPPERAFAMIEEGIRHSAIVALASLEALMVVGGDNASAIALEAAHHDEPEVIRAAMGCVGAHGTDEDLACLIALVPHPDWSVRAEVAELFAKRGFRKALPTLLRRLELEDDAFVRESILGAIHGLGE
jgi:HEAT repeat protein